jgi:hypothetical protein
MPASNGKPSEFILEHDAWGRLVLTDVDGERHVGVEPVRGFPISDPDRWISICDAEGRELLSIADIRTIGAQSRRVLEDDLARREFVPQLKRILNAPPDAEPTTWDVETDRGRTQIVINGSDDVRRLGEHRVLVIDAQGIRYLVDDVRTLDLASRRIFARYL